MPKVNNVVLDEATMSLVEDYAQTMSITTEEAIKSLLTDGVQIVKSNTRKVLKDIKKIQRH